MWIILCALLASIGGYIAGLYLNWMMLILGTVLTTFLFFFGARNITHSTLGFAYTMCWLPSYGMINLVMWLTWLIKTCGPYILKHMP